MDYIWIILLYILSIMMIAKPRLLWKIEHIFTVKNGEPTDLYITLMRLGGIFFLIACIVCTVFVLFQ